MDDAPEPEDLGEDHEVPVHLVELHEMLEMGAALHAQESDG